jgi:hypothetical protein
VKYPALESAILKISDHDFLNTVSNYRNLANHAIPPKLEFGHPVYVTRTLHDASDSSKSLLDELGNAINVNRRCVSYTEDVMYPLKLDAIVESVCCQHENANVALNCLNELLQEVTSLLKLEY